MGNIFFWLLKKIIYRNSPYVSERFNFEKLIFKMLVFHFKSWWILRYSSKICGTNAFGGNILSEKPFLVRSRFEFFLCVSILKFGNGKKEYFNVGSTSSKTSHCTNDIFFKVFQKLYFEKKGFPSLEKQKSPFRKVMHNWCCYLFYI